MQQIPALKRQLATLFTAAISMAAATTASAGFYSSTSFVIFQGTPTISDPRSGTDPVSTVLIRQLGGNVGDTNASADTGSVSAFGNVRSANPQGTKTTAIGELSATANDVIIRRRDGTDVGSSVLASLILSPVLQANFTGAPATQFGSIFNNSDMRWSGSAGGQSVGGSGRVTPLGTTGDLNEQKELIFFATVGEIFPITVTMFAGIGVSASIADPITNTITPATGVLNASVTIGDAFLAPPLRPGLLSADSPAASAAFMPRRAFILPEGFTADSAELNIVDNMWLGPTLAIPEPTSSAQALLAAAFVTRRPRRQ